MILPFAHGDTIAIAVADGVGAALTADGGAVLELDARQMSATLAEIERTLSPRWIWWSADTARTLVAEGLRPARCWDLEAVHRLLVGGWRGGAGRIWAHRRGLDTAELPRVAAPDLFSQPGDDDHVEAVRPDVLLLRAMARALVLWDEVAPTRDWVEAQVPAACAAVSGATTPSILPVPNLAPSGEKRRATP